MNNQIKKNKVRTFRYALYARKSSEEEDSRSICNQIAVMNAEMQRIIEEDSVNIYIKVDTFIDEDYSGTDSQRPAFKQLLGMLATAKLTMLMVTDLSRLSRNISESIHYVQSLFVMLDIRFISTQLPSLDSYLQPEKIYSLEIPMQSMMNENHCAETSMKIRRTFDRLRKDGKFIGAFAAYGWKKDPADKHKLLLDEEPSQIIRCMGRWLIEGKTPGQIATILNERGIANPSTYKKEQRSNHNSTKLVHTYWSSQTIRKILARPENIGDLIQGRSRIKSYKIHKSEKTTPDEWYICKGAIPAIFTESEQLQITHALSRTLRISPSNTANEVYIFSGLLKCPDCGRSIVRKACHHAKYVYYMCNTYKNYGRGCTKHSISHDQLEHAVLISIQKQIELFVNTKAVLEQWQAAPIQQQQLLDTNKLLNKKTAMLENITALKQNLYEDLKSEIITLQEYRKMKANYIQQAIQLEICIKKLQKDITLKQAANTLVPPIVHDLRLYQNIKTLDRELLLQLVDTIYVHEGKRITIVFKFQDAYLALLKEFGHATCQASKTVMKELK